MSIKKIMVVDDSPTERQFLQEILVNKGYQVTTAVNGEEAINRSKTEMPDLILMDVIMPGQNGFQATRTITRDEATKHIAVVMLTSKAQETDKVWGMRQGARDYITKPVEPADLLAMIAALG